MSLDPEEIIELIEMHGRTIVDAAVCDGGCDPIKEAMLLKLERMRELILMLPDHAEAADVRLEKGDDGSVVLHMTPKPKGTMQ